MAEPTFGDELVQLSRAFDSISEPSLLRIYRATRSYVTRVLGISKLELLDEVPVREGRGLKPVLDRDDIYPAYPIRDAEGKPQGLNALTYDLERNLWVTVPASADRQTTLADIAPEQYEELWNRTEIRTEFRRVSPEDRGYGAEHAKTLVSIPVFDRARLCLGVVFFESEDRLVPTDRAKAEFKKIAKGLGRLYELWDQENERQNETQQTADEFADSVDDYAFHYPYSAPLVFGIYPEGTDPNILTAIRDVVEGGDYVWSTWEEMTEDGLIPEQIERRLGQAKFLIAYLSEPEPTPDGDVFVDNPNVLYELGMFRGLLKVPTEPPTAAITIREGTAPEAPFDLSAYRRIDVPRLADGGVDYAEFREQLTAHFDALTT